MADEKTDVQPSETAEEIETPSKDVNEESQTVEGTEDTSSEGENDEKQEGDYYEVEAKRLKDELDQKDKDLAEKNRQIQIKERALQAEKKKKSEPTDRDSLKKEILNEMRFETELGKTSGSQAERDVIKHHYENSIVRTGNVSEDIKRALAIANANRMGELLGRQAAEDAADDASASSMLSTGYGSPQGIKAKSAARKEAEAILKGFKSFKPEMLKKLDQYLPR